MGVNLRVDNWFNYDTANRLITSTYKDPQGWVSSTVTSSYQYDDLGNRQSHDYRYGISPNTIGYQHDKANRMTTLAGLTQGYDLAGNVTLAYSADRGTSYVYKYDHHNRLTGVYDSTSVTRKAAFGWDALGRRIEHVNDVTGGTTHYYYDGVNELVEYDGGSTRQRYYIHGVSYVDERLMMYREADSRPYYFTVDRMYNVRSVIDRAGAIVERYAYDAYGRPFIRESAGRGDMNQTTTLTSTDTTRVAAAIAASIWDPRADIDDDGDCDTNDQALYTTKQPTWSGTFPGGQPVVAQAFSDVGNPYMFQGVPHFSLDVSTNATGEKLTFNHHRARFADPVTGRWITRDPAYYDPTLARTYLRCPLVPAIHPAVAYWEAHSSQTKELNNQGAYISHFELLISRPSYWQDPSGLFCITAVINSCGPTQGAGCTPGNPPWFPDGLAEPGASCSCVWSCTGTCIGTCGCYDLCAGPILWGCTQPPPGGQGQTTSGTITLTGGVSPILSCSCVGGPPPPLDCGC